MAITASSVIRRVVDTLQDGTSIRWPVNELVRYLNDGQREIAAHRPDSMVTNATVALAEGTKQALPAGGTKLIDVVRNTDGRAIRMCNREILDAQAPGWHTVSGVPTILHFMYDPRDPSVFYVYPPASDPSDTIIGGASVDLIYSKLPTDIVEPADGVTYTSVAGNISVPDIYANPLVDYILYRAYSKDAEYAANAQRAVAHYAAFANALGIELKGTLAVAPTTVDNPNAGGASQRGTPQ